MNIFEHNNGTRSIYFLNDLTWERVGEQRYSEKQQILVDGLVEDYRRLFGGDQVKRVLNDNQTAE